MSLSRSYQNSIIKPIIKSSNTSSPIPHGISINSMTLALKSFRINQRRAPQPTVFSPLMIPAALSLTPKKPKALNSNTADPQTEKKIAMLPSLPVLSPEPNTSRSILNLTSPYKVNRRRILKASPTWLKNSLPKLSLKISPSPVSFLTLGTLPPR